MAEVEANGVRLGFDDVGEGDPIVFLGGTGMPAAAWQLVYVPALVDAGYRVVAVDGRGVGRSSAPPPPYSIAEMAADAAALVEHLELVSCGVVGMSLGGFVAETLAWARPDLVRAFVLVASAGWTTAFGRVKAGAERDLIARI